MPARAIAQTGLNEGWDDLPEIHLPGDLQFGQNFLLTVETPKKIPAFWEPGQRQIRHASSNKSG